MSSSQSSPRPSSSKSERGKKKQKQKQQKKKMSGSPSSPAPSEPAEVILDVCDSDVESDETIWDLYERWITQWKLFRTADERRERFATFKKNATHIHTENKLGSTTCKLLLNPNSDMTMEEFENDDHKLCFEHIEIQDRDLESDDTLSDLYDRWMTRYEQPRTLDEKNKRFGAFKEQVQLIHSHNKRENVAYKLGLNQFSDMTTKEFENKYMTSSSPEQMLQLYCKIREDGGIPMEEDYNKGKMDGPRLNFGGVRVLKRNDEEALQAAVLKHPITVWVDSRGDAFKNYRGGVLTVEVGKEPLQAVTLTGFGVTPDGVRFWEVMNSWGEKWGADGFMRIKRGVNLCGIAGFACSPTDLTFPGLS